MRLPRTCFACASVSNLGSSPPKTRGIHSDGGTISGAEAMANRNPWSWWLVRASSVRERNAFRLDSPGPDGWAARASPGRRGVLRLRGFDVGSCRSGMGASLSRESRVVR